MTIKILKSIHEADKESWNSLTKGIFFSYEWFGFAEEFLLSDFEKYYFVSYKDNILNGIFPCFVPNLNDYYYVKYLFGKYYKIFKALGVFPKRQMFCFSPNAFSGNIFTDNGFDEEIAKNLLDRAELVCKETNISEIVIFNFQENFQEKIRFFEDNDFNKIFIHATSVIDRNFSSFEEYLNQRSRNQRKSIKSDLMHFRKSGLKVKLIEDPEKLVDELYNLTLNIKEKHNEQLRWHSKNILQGFYRHMKKSASTYALIDDHKMVACATYLIKDGQLDLYGLGLDYDRCFENRGYFYITYYNTIMSMVKLDAKTGIFGSAVYRLKKRRGCELVKKYILIKDLKKNPIRLLIYKILDVLYLRKFKKQMERP